MKTKILLTFFGLLLALAACKNDRTADTPPADAAAPALTEAEKTQYREKGQEIALATFGALSSQLKAALQEGGVAHAVQYCNTVAYPLVDSLSAVHDAEIRRTTLKVRNPADAPTEAERTVLEAYHAQAAAGEELKPVVQAVDEQTIAFYAPIKMQGLCLSCHGKLGETLQPADYAVIKSLYPEDEAIGYSDGDLRGMWSISFQRPAGQE